MAEADPKWWTQEDSSQNGSWRRVMANIGGWDLGAMTVTSPADGRFVWRVFVAIDGLSIEGEAVNIGDTRPSHDPPTRKIVTDMLRRWVVRTMGKAANVLDALETG